MKDLPAVPKPRQDPEMDNFIYQGKQGRDVRRREVPPPPSERSDRDQPREQSDSAAA
jgi:hypothetical protein